MTASDITAEVVKARFEEAADTLRALRISPRDRPRPQLTVWPDVVHQAMLAYGWSDARVRPAAPSPDAIDRLDVTLTWLWPLDDGERRLVMARAFRLPWRRIEDLDGRSERTLRAIHRLVLTRIASTVARR
ncbi:MAG: DUF6362 family protein [Gemmatimonas sp.]